MTSDAQTALRRIIEDTSKYCRFIMIANNTSKIIEPIQSRCAVFKFTRISEKEVITHLKEIAKKEKIKSDEGGLKAIFDYTEGDLRHAINLLQTASSLGAVTEESVKASAGLIKTKNVDEVLKLALGGKTANARNKMIELIKVYGMSESDFLRYLNESIYKSKTSNLTEISETIAKYDYRILSGQAQRFSFPHLGRARQVREIMRRKDCQSAMEKKLSFKQVMVLFRWTLAYYTITPEPHFYLFRNFVNTSKRPILE